MDQPTDYRMPIDRLMRMRAELTRLRQASLFEIGFNTDVYMDDIGKLLDSMIGEIDTHAMQIGDLARTCLYLMGRVSPEADEHAPGMLALKSMAYRKIQ